MKARAAHLRNLWGIALPTLYRLDVHGADQVDRATVVCFEDRGPLTIPAIRAALQCPVHVLGSDIAVERPGIGAARAGLRALAGNQVVAGHPDDPVLAYLVARSGVDICPVSVFGAHGRIPTDPPRPGRRITVWLGTRRASRERACTVSGVQAAREELRQAATDLNRATDAGPGVS